MKTVHEVSKETGVSIRTLHYYDKIGLLPPDAVSEAGYRLYGSPALARLGQILLFRALEFPLKEIKKILDAPAFDPSEALEQQISLLKLRREHLDQLLTLALELREKGGDAMDFNAFDTSKMDLYTEEVKKRWQDTEPYREHQTKTKNYGAEEWKQAEGELSERFDRFSRLLGSPCEAPEVQAEVELLKQAITRNYYTCTDEILASLGTMYTCDERFRSYLGRFAPGTADFAGKAILYYCQKRR